MVAVMTERIRAEAIVTVQIIMVAPLHRQIRHRRNLNSLVWSCKDGPSCRLCAEDSFVFCAEAFP